MPAELSCHKNMIIQNFQLPFYLILFQKPKENRALLNKKPMEFIILSLSGIAISKVQISYSGMITSLSPNF